MYSAIFCYLLEFLVGEKKSIIFLIDAVLSPKIRFTNMFFYFVYLYEYSSVFCLRTNVLMYIFLSASKIKYEIYETFWTSLRAYLVNLSKLCFLSTLILFKVSSKTLYLTSTYIFTYSLSICARYVSQITLKLNISSLLSLFDNAICQMDDLCQSGACILSRFTSFLFASWRFLKIYFRYQRYVSCIIQLI